MEKVLHFPLLFSLFIAHDVKLWMAIILASELVTHPTVVVPLSMVLGLFGRIGSVGSSCGGIGGLSEGTVVYFIELTLYWQTKMMLHLHAVFI